MDDSQFVLTQIKLFHVLSPPLFDDSYIRHRQNHVSHVHLEVIYVKYFQELELLHELNSGTTRVVKIKVKVKIATASEGLKIRQTTS